MTRTLSPYRAFQFFLLATLTSCTSCDPQAREGIAELARNLQDSDGDGWMDAQTNQRIDLIIDEITIQPALSRYHLIVDDHIVVDIGSPLRPGTVATTRCAGQWHAGRLLDYRARLKFVENGDQALTLEDRLPFHNRDSTYQRVFNYNGKSIALLYRTVVTRFADPSPDDANGDADADGITDAEEAILAQENIRVGDPLKRDVVVCVGYTSPVFFMTKRGMERITTVFAGRDVNVLFADGTNSLPGLRPGQVMFPNSNGVRVVPPQDRAVVSGELADIRTFHMDPDLAPFTHLLVMARDVRPGFYGEASPMTRSLAVASHFQALGPEPLGMEYQTKVIMHELGHNLGLCHPNQSDTSCLTGSIPVAERDGSLTVMGSPADDGGILSLQALTNAFNRPLDFTTTQWTNANYALGRMSP